MSIDPFGIACEKAFPCGVGTNNEERESKTARKMAQVKEQGWGGEERKCARDRPKRPWAILR